MKARTVSSIMRHVASRLPSFDLDAGDGSAGAPSGAKKDQDKEGDGGAGADEIVPPAGPSEEERLEKLYEQIAWPLGKKYGNMYDAFKLALTQVFFSSSFSLFGHLLPFRYFLLV
jgi:translation initiation factor 2 subunit 1